MTRSIGTLTCSYRRPDSLRRGLAALAAQQRRPDAVVVARADDAATLAVLGELVATSLPLRVVTVTQPGTVHALNAGLDASICDVVAITDDDTVPHPDWLARILEHFAADPKLGGLGGRDWVYDGQRFDDREAAVVGRVQWCGRAIGNHHLGVGAPRPVEFLKGANMSYRTRAIAGLRFDPRLRGSGAQPCEDFTFSASVRRAGWTLLYDPKVAVDHYSGQRDEPRHYVGVSTARDAKGLSDAAHNEVIALWPNLSLQRRAAYALWSVLVGTGVTPGLLQALRYTPVLGRTSWWRFRVTQAGKYAAYKALRAKVTPEGSIVAEAPVPAVGDLKRPA